MASFFQQYINYFMIIPHSPLWLVDVFFPHRKLWMFGILNGSKGNLKWSANLFSWFQWLYTFERTINHKEGILSAKVDKWKTLRPTQCCFVSMITWRQYRKTICAKDFPFSLSWGDLEQLKKKNYSTHFVFVTRLTSRNLLCFVFPIKHLAVSLFLI